jgi:membrane protein
VLKRVVTGAHPIIRIAMVNDDTIVWEPGGTEAETAAGTARRYRKPLKSFRWCDLKALFADTINEWYKHKAPRLGASLAFYTLLSLAPLLVIIVALTGSVFGEEAARGQIVGQLSGLVGTTGATAIEEVIKQARQPTVGFFATLAGLITLFLGATGVVTELRDALNTIYEIPAPEVSGLKTIVMFVRERFFSFAMVVAVGFLLLVSLAVNAWLAAMGTWITGWLPALLLQIASTLASWVIITGLFAGIYKALPDVTIEWRDVILGAAVTSLLFNLGKFLIGLYLGTSTIASAYGAAGSLVILLIWVYYSAQIFFLGAEFTQVFANRYGSQPTLRAKRALLGRLHTLAPKPQVPPTLATPEHGGKQLA